MIYFTLHYSSVTYCTLLKLYLYMVSFYICSIIVYYLEFGIYKWNWLVIFPFYIYSLYGNKVTLTLKNKGRLLFLYSLEQFTYIRWQFLEFLVKIACKTVGMGSIFNGYRVFFFFNDYRFLPFLLEQFWQLIILVISIVLKFPIFSPKFIYIF